MKLFYVKLTWQKCNLKKISVGSGQINMGGNMGPLMWRKMEGKQKLSHVRLWYYCVSGQSPMVFDFYIYTHQSGMAFLTPPPTLLLSLPLGFSSVRPFWNNLSILSALRFYPQRLSIIHVPPFSFLFKWIFLKEKRKRRKKNSPQFLNRTLCLFRAIVETLHQLRNFSEKVFILFFYWKKILFNLFHMKFEICGVEYISATNFPFFVVLMRCL